MTYDQFIDDLRKLIPAGEALRGGNDSAGTRGFRDWRHRAENAVVGIQTEGFVVPGGFRSSARHYRVPSDLASPRQNRDRFELDLGDSLTELRYIVEQFESNGPPRQQMVNTAVATATTSAAPTTPLLLPDRMTVRWLIDNVPVTFWWSVAGAVVVIFFAGFIFGQIPPIHSAVCWLKPDVCITPASPSSAVLPGKITLPTTPSPIASQPRATTNSAPPPSMISIQSVCTDPTASNCAGVNYGSQVVKGYIPPRKRIISTRQRAAATAELSKAPTGSVIRLNYAAENGVDEVENFYAQVEAIFSDSQHWQVVPSRIGKSMGFADGGALTGEGVRCTSYSETGKKAIEAMRLAGFPCIGEARDWSVSYESRPRSDVVISIGSRFVPSE